MKYYSRAIIIAISVLGAAYILSVGYKFKFKSTDGISVVGMAQVDFTSDLIVWEGSYSKKSADLKTAYANVIVEKYVDHLPLSRQEKRYERQGVVLTESKLRDTITS